MGSCFGTEIHVIRDEQIEVTITVEIEEAAARAPTSSGLTETGPFSYVRKRAIAIVVIEHVLAPIRNEEVIEPIVVIIPNTAALTPARMR